MNVVGTVTATSFVGDVFADNIRLGAADAQTVVEKFRSVMEGKLKGIAET